MATWKDSTGTKHVLRITVPKASELKTSTGVDLAACLTDQRAVEKVLKQLQDPVILMACCATIEGITDDKVDAYCDLWDGDAFENAGEAIMEAIADFFPEAPRRVFKAILQKATTAARRAQEIGLEAAMEAVAKMDFSLVPNESETRGSGFTVFAP